MSTLFLANNKMTDDGTVTYSLSVGTENAQFPLTNMNDEHTTKVFRSTGNSCTFVADTQSLSACDTFAIVGSGVEGLGITACSIYLSPTTDFTGVAENVVELNSEYSFGYVRFTSSAYRYMKVVITGGGSYCEVSNMYLGAATEFANNGIDRSSFKYSTVDNSKILKNKYGQRFINQYNKIRRMECSIKTMNSAELTILHGIYKAHGTSKPIWFMADTEEDTITDADFIFSGYFFFTGRGTFKSRSGILFDSSFMLEEAV